jgi:hypothetical protein
MSEDGGETHGAPLASTLSSRGLAELAKAGYVVLDQPYMQVDFEVHHLTDHAGYLYQLLSAGPPAERPTGHLLSDERQADDSSSGLDEDELPDRPLTGEPSSKAASFVETLTTGANGIGLVIGTRTGAVDALYRNSSSAPVEWIDRPRRLQNIFRGVARPNPTFSYASSRIFEGLVGIDQPAARTLSFERSVEVRDLLAFVARLAASENQAPMLSAQWPAQLPIRGKGSGEQRIRTRDQGNPPFASSLALRFAIALPPATSGRRIELANRLRTYCEEEGYALWIADTRPGYGVGNWYHICSLDSSRLRADHDGSPDQDVRLTLPVTFVGPARVGSTLAIMEFLRSLPFVGVLACSNTTLDDLAFIHLQLSLNGLTTSNVVRANSALKRVEARNGSPADVLIRIFSALGYERQAVPEGLSSANVGSRMWDYATLVGSLFPVRTSERRRAALWFSWQSDRVDAGLSAPLRALYQSFERIGLVELSGRRAFRHEGAPTLEYLVCRQTSGRKVKGKGKLSIPKDLVDNRFPGDGREPAISRFCAVVEAVWRNQLADKSVDELAVSWRESWLGDWASQ